MTTSRVRPTTNPRRILVFGVAAAGGALLGAYLDWYMWHPMSAIVTTIFLGLIGLIGVIAALVRQRLVRPAGLVLIAFAVGGFVGQALGPQRPTTFHTDTTGTIRLVLDGGTNLDATGAASCGMVSDGSGQYLVDPDEFGVARPTEDADFHYVNVAIGDMWDFGDALARPDHLSVTVRMVKAIVPADGKPSEIELTSDAASQMILHAATPAGGSLSFANLAVRRVGDAGISGRSNLAGTVTWTCGNSAPAEDPQADPLDAPPPDS